MPLLRGHATQCASAAEPALSHASAAADWPAAAAPAPAVGCGFFTALRCLSNPVDLVLARPHERGDQSTLLWSFFVRASLPGNVAPRSSRPGIVPPFPPVFRKY